MGKEGRGRAARWAALWTGALLLVGALRAQDASLSATPDANPASQGVAPAIAFAIEALEPRAGVDPLRLATGSASKARWLGVLVWRRSDGPCGRRNEWDVHWLAPRARLIVVETQLGGARQLLWRELLPGLGRTLSLEASGADAAWHAREWSGRRGLSEFDVSEVDALLPLEALDVLARDPRSARDVVVFDPLSNACERLHAVALPASREDADAGAEAALEGVFVELRREDGTCAGRMCFRAGELSAFQWQAGDVRARRIEIAEAERFLASMDAFQVEAAAPAPRIDAAVTR